MENFQFSSYDKSKFVVLPVPYEQTTSFIKGTKAAPAAIIKTLTEQVETFDEELLFDASDPVPYGTGQGVYLDKPLKITARTLPKISRAISKIIEENKVPVMLGGEHSITPYAVQAAASKVKGLSVLQLDAHADLRKSYDGTSDSHACAGFNILKHASLVQVGVRSISQQEHEFAEKTGQINNMFFMHEYSDRDIPNILKKLSKNVYITIDADVFDPSVVAAVGNPEPGGFLWRQMLKLLQEVVKNKNVVGFDVVELSPKPGMQAADMAMARLAYKAITYISLKKHCAF